MILFITLALRLSPFSFFNKKEGLEISVAEIIINSIASNAHDEVA